MREFNQVLDQLITTGIDPKTRKSRSAPSLNLLFNGIPTELGLFVAPSLENPLVDYSVGDLEVVSYPILNDESWKQTGFATWSYLEADHSWNAAYPACDLYYQHIISAPGDYRIGLYIQNPGLKTILVTVTNNGQPIEAISEAINSIITSDYPSYSFVVSPENVGTLEVLISYVFDGVVGTIKVMGLWISSHDFVAASDAIILNSPTKRYVVSEGSLYDATTGSMIPLTVYEADDYVTETTISVDRSLPSELLSFGHSWFMALGDCLVSETFFTNRIVSLTNPLFKTVSKYRDRLVLAGISGTVPSLMTQLYQQSIYFDLVSSTRKVGDTIGLNSLMYSTVAGGDMNKPFELEMAILGSPTDYRDELVPLIWDSMRNGSIGFAAIPDDEIRFVKQLGTKLMVYGSRAIYLGDFVQSDERQSLVLLEIFPIVAKAVSGSIHEHLVLEDSSSGATHSRRGHLFRITENLQISDLDYSRALSALESTSIFFHEVERLYYIYDTSRCLVLSPRGLYETVQLPSNLSLRDRTAEAVFAKSYRLAEVTPSDSSHEIVYLHSNPIDFGNTGLKTIRWINVRGTLFTNVQVRVTASYSQNSGVDVSEWIDVNDNGFAHIGVSGELFNIELRGTYAPGNSSEPCFTGLDIRWQQDDKRFLRGGYATQVATSAD